KITDTFKYYTWLDLDHPAHRALLRFNSAEEVAFERVFSWLDVNLKSNSFAGSVAENLDVFNPTNGTLQFSDALRAPRVITDTVDVGQRIDPPEGTPTNNYLAGHI